MRISHVWFGSSGKELVQLLIRARNIFGWTVRTLLMYYKTCCSTTNIIKPQCSSVQSLCPCSSASLLDSACCRSLHVPMCSQTSSFFWCSDHFCLHMLNTVNLVNVKLYYATHTLSKGA